MPTAGGSAGPDSRRHVHDGVKPRASSELKIRRYPSSSERAGDSRQRSARSRLLEHGDCCRRSLVGRRFSLAARLKIPALRPGGITRALAFSAPPETRAFTIRIGPPPQANRSMASLTCYRVQKHEVLEVGDLASLPFLRHVRRAHQLARRHHRRPPTVKRAKIHHFNHHLSPLFIP